MSNFVTVKIENNWSATLNTSTGKVEVTDAEGHYATSGQWEWSGRIADAPGDIDEEIFESLEAALHVAVKSADAAPIIERVFANYADVSTAAEGFVDWAWDMRQETRCGLADDELFELADNVAYTVKQAYQVDGAVREVSIDEATQWLRQNRAELIAALDESLADD